MNDSNVFAMRHSAAHLLAAAIAKRFPEAKFGVGPVVEHGFYYDVLFPEPISDAFLKKIEKDMRALQKQGFAMEREEMGIDEAIAFFSERKQEFKVELLQALKEKGTTALNSDELQDFEGGAETVSIYKTGEFVDLCRGPHVSNVKEIGAFTLTKIAGAYWRGDEKNPQLTRVYGLCFATQEELDAHLAMLEEAKKRDHRKLGAELELFTFSPLVGPGLPLFTAKGTMLRQTITDALWSIMKEYRYERVWIPHIAKSDLYKTSGHWDKFEDDLFHVSSKKTDEQFVLKPMNCPHHTQIYASRPRSYRDLPIRMSENTTVYRDENTGQLAGLSRVRSITQDDAHVFCRPDQVLDEVLAIYDIANRFYDKFGMSFSRVRLSVRDPKNPGAYLGDSAVWDSSEKMLREAMEKVSREVEVGEGEAAFYGPKLDFMTKDAIGREWQLATIQLDFNQPERFGLEYTDKDGERKRPVMVHRAILGSVERFMGVMIEHFAGAFPFWLAPEQIRLITVSDQFEGFAKGLLAKLEEAGIRATVDASNEGVGKKIRNSAMAKIPWSIVIGEKEIAGEPLRITVFGGEERIVSQEKLLDEVKHA